MINDPAELIQSIGSFATKVNDKIDRNQAASDKTIEDLTAEMNAQAAEFGNETGGEQSVAIMERYVALGDEESEIDCWLANHFGKTVVADTTFTFTHAPLTGRVYTLVLRLTNAGAFNVSFWNNISWNEGNAPEFTAAGRDTVAFTTVDGGVTWDGYLLGKDMKIPV